MPRPSTCDPPNTGFVGVPLVGGTRRIVTAFVLSGFLVGSPGTLFAQTTDPAPGTRPALSTPPVSTPAGPAAALAQSPYGKQEKLDYRIILTGYKDNYFITGFSNATQVKFQLSVKVDLWPNPTSHSAYFGYTQKSIWNLYALSSPFVDSNYNPELFYGYFMHYGGVFWKPGTIVPFVASARVGVEHESNGRDGTASRAWNRVYGYIQGGVYFGTDYFATLGLKAWAPPFAVDSDNADIVRYRGYGEATLVYGYDPVSPTWWGGGQLGATYFHGASATLSRQGLEAFAEWRPAYGVSSWRFTPYIYVQLFAGYGEYLLAYDQRETAFRAGISFEDRVHWVDRAP
jgi:outer membrane phospholipase A